VELTHDGREAVTFTCGNRIGSPAHALLATRLVTGVFMSMIKSAVPANLDEPRASEVEGEIREFVRRDGAVLRRAPDSDGELVANNIGVLVQRVAGSSVNEIDRLISELHTLREHLQNEGARVQREIAEYAQLSQSAMQSTKIIAESLAQWKTAGPSSGR
jgi:hypothetical protein